MKKTKIMSLILGVLLTVLLTGCEYMTIGGKTYTVTVKNNATKFYADDLNITDHTASNWGDDVLPTDTSIDPGESIEVEVSGITTPDSVDVRAQDRIYSAERTGKELDITKTIYITDTGITN